MVLQQLHFARYDLSRLCAQDDELVWFKPAARDKFKRLE